MNIAILILINKIYFNKAIILYCFLSKLCLIVALMIKKWYRDIKLENKIKMTWMIVLEGNKKIGKIGSHTRWMSTLMILS